MVKKPSYEQLEQRLMELEKEASARKQAEQALKPTEQEERAILDSLLELVIYQDTEMNVLWANQAACESVGRMREDIVGRYCYEIWAGRQSTCEDCPVAKARDTGQPQAVEKATPDGRWWYIQGYPVRDNTGHIVGMTELTLDITERKRAVEALQKAYDDMEHRVEERTAHLVATTEKLEKEIAEREVTQRALENSEKLLSDVFNAIQDCVMVIDKDLRVVMSNWKGHGCVSEKERQGRPHCYASFMKRETPCEPCHALEVFATGKTKELEHTNPLDGKTREIRILPVFDNKQNVIMVVEHLRDITERKHAEDALRESEAQKRAILDASIDRIRYIDKDMRIIWANKTTADAFNMSPEDLVGQVCYRLYIGRDAPCEGCPTKKSQETGQPERAVIHQPKVKGIEGESYWDNYSVPIKNEAGDIVSFIQIARNITDQRRAEEHIRTLTHELIKAQESERQKISRDLHDSVAQELSTLRIACDTLLDNQPMVSAEIQQRVSDLSKSLQGTIAAVRNLSYDLRPATLDQLGLVQTVFRYCEDFSESFGVNVEFSSAGMDKMALDFDTEINLYRLIQEGLNNIRKHADASHVTIRLMGAFPHIILGIEDNGKGFDLEDQLVTAASKNRMGLRSMQERVSLLGGTMTIRSKQGHGTRLFIRVPGVENKGGTKENHIDR